MQPTTEFVHPKPSFEFPVSPPLSDPDTGDQICVQFGAEWLPFVLGSLFQLFNQGTWDVTSEVDLLLAQRRVNQLVWLFQVQTKCAVPTSGQTGQEIEEMSVLRVDCDCNIFVTCCDGTEKQILTSDQVQKLIAGGAIQGAPQPGTSGGTAKYNICVGGVAGQLIPTPVSTGDLITVLSAAGATSDSLLGYWRCPDGSIFFAGACTGSPAFDAGALVPAAPLGSLVVLIGSNYYSLQTPLTVPGGVSSVQPILFTNWPTGGAFNGSVCADIEVKNNAAGTYAHTFDFTLSSAGFYQHPQTYLAGHWVGGAGWTYDDVGGGGNFYRALDIKKDLARPGTWTSLEFFFNWTKGGVPPGNELLNIGHDGGAIDGDYAFPSSSDFPGSDPRDVTVSITIAATTSLFFGFQPDFQGTLGALAGNVVLHKLIVRGTGVDPF